jgi:hypothetical protein
LLAVTGAVTVIEKVGSVATRLPSLTLIEIEL